MILQFRDTICRERGKRGNIEGEKDRKHRMKEEHRGETRDEREKGTAREETQDRRRGDRHRHHRRTGRKADRHTNGLPYILVSRKTPHTLARIADNELDHTDHTIGVQQLPYITYCKITHPHRDKLLRRISPKVGVCDTKYELVQATSPKFRQPRMPHAIATRMVTYLASC